MSEPEEIATARNARWVLPDEPGVEAHGLAAALEQPLWFAQVLVSRGIETPADARRFLIPDMAALHDPMLLGGMKEAVARVLQAVAKREPILIYGDYDVDGTTATVLLKTAIDRITPTGGPSLVRYHIPHRIREGYGIQSSVLAEAATQGIRLVISVDTGIRAFAAAEESKRLGLDLIVTDHHLPDGMQGIPEAIAVINPNQPGCDYPYKELCGAAVAFKLAHALLHAATKPAADPNAYRAVDFLALWDKLLPSLLKLVAIATIADSVPLTGENRVIVALGLRALRDQRQSGLRALFDLAGVVSDEERGPSATDIAFRVAPRINAAGRMDVAADVVRMFLARTPEEGAALAAKLHQLNEDRRNVEASVLATLETQMEALRSDESALGTMGCLVLDGEGWHRGVIGILASRVVERMRRPALVIAHEDGQAHGSGRSVSGFHLLDAITAAHTETEPLLFDRFGGHAHAVGFSLPSDRVPLLRERLSTYSLGRLSSAMLQERIAIDAELPSAELNPDLIKKLHLLEPFGQGNREPLFLSRDCQVEEAPKTLKERHIKLRIRISPESTVDCLGWSREIVWPEKIAEMGIASGSRVDVVYRVRENRHPQFGGVEMELCDLRLTPVSTTN
ncbi:single-stranded-DNA-specific exonuclease RecJ [Terriglobus sp. TAA 43]|uniref:single-stranded-DNA-specific exonuclease RecJ n=1 Tax=Terriglobus sp. TAA 43 TaxID=278961 RepID=UPI00068BA6C6|nr:single-stranded-DNA-specific exonuclease RecJ [Terriglobus sp. TAA 43]